MILYTPFWATLKEKGISTYALVKRHKVSNSTLTRMRKNLPITTTTINDLCRILNCKVSEILAYVPCESEEEAKDA